VESALRSFDILTALAQVLGEEEAWGPDRVQWLLGASPAEHAESLHRLVRARLARPTDDRLLREPLLRFLVHGVPHAFPGAIGTPTTGVPTGGGAPFVGHIGQLIGNELVWAAASGNAHGRSVEPLDPRVPAIALRDERMHALLAAVDLLRVGRARARRVALSFLAQEMLGRTVAVPEWHLEVLDRRIADHEARPDDVVSWSDLEGELGQTRR
jgi:hypothetical protein